MTDRVSVEQEIQATIEAVVRLHANSVLVQQKSDENVLVWTPSEGNKIDWGNSKPITFIKNRFVPSNIYKTDDVQVFTEMNSLHQLDLFMGYWPDAQNLLLQDKSPLIVREKSESGERQNKLKVLRVIGKEGVQKRYYVDMLQADNLTALENPSSATEITDENSPYIYPAVVRVNDLRKDFKGIGPKIENKIAVSFFSFADLDINEAQKQYLKPLIAKAEEKIWK